jgi:cobalt-zinc-cadmium efflux system protein
MKTTIPTYRECMRILMEVQPTGIDNESLRKKITDLDGVEECSDLHTFALAGQKNVLSCHIIMKQSGDIAKAREINAKV